MGLPISFLIRSMVKRALPFLALLLMFAGSASAQTTIAVGQTRSGSLSAASGRSVKCPDCFADLYQFSVSSTQTLLISMNSEAFLGLIPEAVSIRTSRSRGGARFARRRP